VSWREPAPGEREAGDRTWEVVRAAFGERLPAPRSRDWRPLVALAAGVAILAAAFTPPGHAVLDSIRDAVRGEKNAKPALVSLPTAKSRLLVNSAEGAWIVQSDGSKRLLAGYRNASWSPNGLYLAAVHGEELRAIEPDGDVRWSIGRAGPISAPRWSFEGYRIAYFAGTELRVINGDGTDDRVLARNAARASAWEPDTHNLAFVNRDGNIQIVNVDRPQPSAVIRTRIGPHQLLWARDGHALVAVGRHAIAVFGARGFQSRLLNRGAATVAGASVSSDGRTIAFTERERGRSTLRLTAVNGGPPRQVFAGAGNFANVVWGPDSRWLLLDWQSADQWLFIRSAAVRKIVAVSNVEVNFGRGASLAGWCCP
jgi:WD40-like Beta Propeller Repeat